MRKKCIGAGLYANFVHIFCKITFGKDEVTSSNLVSSSKKKDMTKGHVFLFCSAAEGRLLPLI